MQRKLFTMSILLQAKEFGEAEVWMNERLMRAAPQYFAQFITAFEDGEQRNAPQRGPVSLSSAFYLQLMPIGVVSGTLLGVQWPRSAPIGTLFR